MAKNPHTNTVFEFIASGYRFSDNKPYNGAEIKVITNELKIYNCRYNTAIKNLSPGEEVFAWKYL